MSKLNSAGLPLMPMINPLSQSDLDQIESIIQRARAHADLIARANAAGVDVTNHAQRNQMHVDVAEKLKEMFFPPTLSAPETVPVDTVGGGSHLMRGPTDIDERSQVNTRGQNLPPI